MRRSPLLSGLLGEVLERGAVRMRVTGGSMAPFIRPGEIVVIRRVSCTELRHGDIILFRDGRGEPVLHRVVRRVKGCGRLTFQTKGDALALLDEPVGEHDVMGKVIRVERATDGGKAVRLDDMESSGWRWVNRLVAAAGLVESWLYFSALKPFGLEGRFRPALRSPVMRFVYRLLY